MSQLRRDTCHFWLYVIAHYKSHDCPVTRQMGGQKCPIPGNTRPMCYSDRNTMKLHKKYLMISNRDSLDCKIQTQTVRQTRINFFLQNLKKVRGTAWLYVSPKDGLLIFRWVFYCLSRISVLPLIPASAAAIEGELLPHSSFTFSSIFLIESYCLSVPSSSNNCRALVPRLASWT